RECPEDPAARARRIRSLCQTPRRQSAVFAGITACPQNWGQAGAVPKRWRLRFGRARSGIRNDDGLEWGRVGDVPRLEWDRVANGKGSGRRQTRTWTTQERAVLVS